MPEICAVNYIDHVGVAVNDIQAALEFFGTNFGALTLRWSSWMTRRCAPA